MGDVLLLMKGVLQDPHTDAGRATGRDRMLVALSLLLWAGAVTAGRLLAYTYNTLMASHLY